LNYKAFEEQWLHPLAIRSHQNQGRETPCSPCPLRNAFQRDRDRILHSKAFRRLKHKTQVFISPAGDHYRTRLTHSLEVAQIARTMARALRLNEDFTEAVALGHDMGHPPFGHAGEDALKSGSPLGFCHSLHSYRIATVLEPLNLTRDVLDGIVKQKAGQTPATVEAQLVELADRIAYLHHDVEDAIRSGLLQEEDIPKALRDALGHNRKQRLDTMVLDLVKTTSALLDDGQATVRLSPQVWEPTMALRRWMFDTVYLSPKQKRKDVKVKQLLHGLLGYYRQHPEALPPLPETQAKPSEEQRLLDYVAGMTDRFALATYIEKLLPVPYPASTEPFSF
jgi:dGTPase